MPLCFIPEKHIRALPLMDIVGNYIKPEGYHAPASIPPIVVESEPMQFYYKVPEQDDLPIKGYLLELDGGIADIQAIHFLPVVAFPFAVASLISL